MIQTNSNANRGLVLHIPTCPSRTLTHALGGTCIQTLYNKITSGPAAKTEISLVKSLKIRHDSNINDILNFISGISERKERLTKPKQ